MIYRALVMMLSAIWKSVKNYVAVMLNVGVPCMGTETAGVQFYMFQSEYDKQNYFGKFTTINPLCLYGKELM